MCVIEANFYRCRASADFLCDLTTLSKLPSYIMNIVIQANADQRFGRVAIDFDLLESKFDKSTRDDGHLTMMVIMWPTRRLMRMTT